MRSARPRCCRSSCAARRGARGARPRAAAGHAAPDDRRPAARRPTRSRTPAPATQPTPTRPPPSLDRPRARRLPPHAAARSRRSPRAPRRLGASPPPRLVPEVYHEGAEPLAGLLVHAPDRRAQGDRPGPRRRRRPARSSRRGRATRSRGRWPAAIPGAFGRKVNSPWIWIPLCVLFVAPFVDSRRPLRGAAPRPARAASRSRLAGVLQRRAHRHLGAARRTRCCSTCWRACCWIGLPRAARPVEPALRLHVPSRGWLAVGARLPDRLPHRPQRHELERDRRRLLGRHRRRQAHATASASTATFPKDNEHGDTYGPVAYVAYVPFEQALPWTGAGTTCRPRTRAAIASTCCACALLFLIGRRMRGPDARHRARLRVGGVSVHALRARTTNTNDALVAALVLAALLVARAAAGARRAGRARPG